MPGVSFQSRLLGRPGRETGARIETRSRGRLLLCLVSRPGRETGARIETEMRIAPLPVKDESPRSRDRGAD